VKRFRPWMDAFAVSYWVFVMSYTCRVTSDMAPVSCVTRVTPPSSGRGVADNSGFRGSKCV
jgi:hypothetical protein